METQELNKFKTDPYEIKAIRSSLDVLSKSINLLNHVVTPESTIMTKDIVQFEDEELDDMGDLFQSAYGKITMMTYKISERYKNKNTTYSFLETHLHQIHSINPLSSELEKHIFKFIDEYDYLLKLKNNVEKYLHQISQLLWRDPVTKEYSEEFLKIFNHAAGVKESTEEYQKQAPEKYERNPRFIFENLKEECDSVRGLADRIEWIEDRLNEFHHWLLKSDTAYREGDSGPLYLTASEHYPLFEEQCELEKSHLIRKMERRGDTQPTANTTNASRYEWKVTDTDLVELAVALFQTNAIARKDGKPTSRKEIIEHLAVLFDKEIKDPEGKLKFAVARKKEKAPFLDCLRKSFENYAEERDR